MTTYKLTLSTLSYLHIGDGAELRQDFDFKVKDDYTYFFDQDAVLDAKEKELNARYRTSGHYPAPGIFITDEDLANKQLIRYKLKGTPNTKRPNTFTPIRSFIKSYDVSIGEFSPYIPGSSLKGAFRNALGWANWDVSMRAKLGLPDNPKQVDDQIEKSLFVKNPFGQDLSGKEPNYDLMRALQISDLLTKTPLSKCLFVARGFVWTIRGGKASPISLEAIKDNVTFAGTLKIDETLFGSNTHYGKQVEEKLGFSAKRQWLENLFSIVQNRSTAQLEKLVKWFEKAPEGGDIAKFYRMLIEYIPKLSSNQAFVQFAWGSGWDGMTYGSKLEELPDFENIVRRYKIQPTHRREPLIKGEPFPESRRIAVNKDGKPIAPFGWALVEME